MTLLDLKATLEAEMRQLGNNLVAVQRKDEITLHGKDGNDYFTVSDMTTQAPLMRAVHEYDPTITLLGEERVSDAIRVMAETNDDLAAAVATIDEVTAGEKDPSKVMHIDPIDGTRMFREGGEMWSMALSYTINDLPVLSMIRQPRKSISIYAIGEDGDVGSHQVGYENEATGAIGKPIVSDSTYIGELNVHLVTVTTKYGDTPVLPGFNQRDVRARLLQDFEGNFSPKRHDRMIIGREGSGSSASAYARMALGNMHGYVGLTQARQDVVPGAHILTATGGKVIALPCNAKTGESLEHQFNDWLDHRASFPNDDIKYHVIGAAVPKNADLLHDIVTGTYNMVTPAPKDS